MVMRCALSLAGIQFIYSVHFRDNIHVLRKLADFRADRETNKPAPVAPSIIQRKQNIELHIKGRLKGRGLYNS